MSETSNERIEREALESLVASDLSAKMKQWRNQPPPGNNNNRLLVTLLMLLFLGGAAWWFLSPKAAPMPKKPELPAVPPAPPGQSVPPPAAPQTQEPMAQKNAPDRYLALAQTHYQPPNFSADIRGDANTARNALNDARAALAAHHPADALDALQQAPPAFQTDADYLRAHAFFALKKYTQSAALFHQLTGSVRYGEAAQWYEILAMLPAFERNKSLIESRLGVLAADNAHTYQKDARQLLKAVK